MKKTATEEVDNEAEKKAARLQAEAESEGGRRRGEGGGGGDRQRSGGGGPTKRRVPSRRPAQVVVADQDNFGKPVECYNCFSAIINLYNFNF